MLRLLYALSMISIFIQKMINMTIDGPNLLQLGLLFYGLVIVEIDN